MIGACRTSMCRGGGGGGVGGYFPVRPQASTPPSGSLDMPTRRTIYIFFSFERCAPRLCLRSSPGFRFGERQRTCPFLQKKKKCFFRYIDDSLSNRFARNFAPALLRSKGTWIPSGFSSETLPNKESFQREYFS